MKTRSKLIFIMALAFLAIMVNLQQQKVVASTQYSLTIINNSTHFMDLPLFLERPPELKLHGTYDYSSPSHPELHVNANFDDSTHGDPNLHIHIDGLKPGNGDSGH